MGHSQKKSSFLFSNSEETNFQEGVSRRVLRFFFLAVSLSPRPPAAFALVFVHFHGACPTNLILTQQVLLYFVKDLPILEVCTMKLETIL